MIYYIIYYNYIIIILYIIITYLLNLTEITCMAKNSPQYMLRETLIFKSLLHIEIKFFKLNRRFELICVFLCW